MNAAGHYRETCVNECYHYMKKVSKYYPGRNNMINIYRYVYRYIYMNMMINVLSQNEYFLGFRKVCNLQNILHSIL